MLMIERDPTAEPGPYVSMDCTPEQGLLVLDILGYRLSNSERGHVNEAFYRILEKHEGSLLKTVCELYAYDVMNMRRLSNTKRDPRFRRTGSYDVAVIHFWENVKEAELVEKLQSGQTLSYIHYVKSTVELVLKEAEEIGTQEKIESKDRDIWSASDTGECPKEELGRLDDRLDDKLDDGW